MVLHLVTIPATLVVGFTAQRSIFRCCPIPLPNFKIGRFSLRLCIQCCDRPGRECPELEYRDGQVVLMSWCSSVCFVAIFPQLCCFASCLSTICHHVYHLPYRNIRRISCPDNYQSDCAGIRIVNSVC